MTPEATENPEISVGVEIKTADLVGAYTVTCHITDKQYSFWEPALEFLFLSDEWPTEESRRTLSFRSIHIDPAAEFSKPYLGFWLSASLLRDFPFHRWESTARSVAMVWLDDHLEEYKHATISTSTSTSWQAMAEDSRTPEQMAADLVDRLYPQQGQLPGIDRPPTRGEARTRRSLHKLALVAVQYRQLLAAGRRDPANAIAQQYSVSSATARSWIFRAREKGFLGQAYNRTAGIAPMEQHGIAVNETADEPVTSDDTGDGHRLDTSREDGEER